MSEIICSFLQLRGVDLHGYSSLWMNASLLGLPMQFEEALEGHSPHAIQPHAKYQELYLQLALLKDCP